MTGRDRKDQRRHKKDAQKRWSKPELKILRAGSAESNPNPSSDFNEVGFS